MMAATGSTAGRVRALAAMGMLGLLAACATVPDDALKGEAAYGAMPPAAPVGIDYHIAADDVLRISIYHEPGLSLEDAAVTAAGMVRMPLVGDVSVAGLSASEAADVIAGRYGARYLNNPQVTVFIKTAASRRITVDGEVRQPGVYPIEGRTGLLSAVAMAHGPSRMAALGQVVVIRPANGDRQVAIFDLSAIRAARAPDPEILPGDTVIMGLSRAKAILGSALLAAPIVGAGFIALGD